MPAPLRPRILVVEDPGRDLLRDALGRAGFAVDTTETTAIPVVFLTAETAISYRSVSLMLGGLAHLQKPFTLDALRAVVEETVSP